MMSEKVGTPRDNQSVRSGMNSSRRKYEQIQKYNSSDKDGSEYNDNISPTHSKDLDTKSIKKPIEDMDQKEIDDMLDKFANREIDMTKGDKTENDKSDLDVMCSVDTPQADSDHASSFNQTQNVVIGPKESEGDSSSETEEPFVDNNKPINFDIRIKDYPSADKSDSSEVDELKNQNDPSNQSLSRKKSEQRLSDMKSKIPIKSEAKKIKSTITPTPQAKPNLMNPFNSDNFFTQNFDDQEMEAAIEHLKNSSGKMGLASKTEDSGDNKSELGLKDQLNLQNEKGMIES